MFLNNWKCVFGVDDWKLLGFIILHYGNELDTKKIDAIVNILRPRNISQLQSLQGKKQAICPFVSQLVDQTLPPTQFLNKDNSFKLNVGCKNSFDDLKCYLPNPPILQPFIPN